MAARLRAKHQDYVRTKIQTSQLINRLEKYALSDDEAEITPGRLKAIEILLRKSLPDLSATQLTGADGGAIEIAKIERVVVDPKA
jgi:hypothetical protein